MTFSRPRTGEREWKALRRELLRRIDAEKHFGGSDFSEGIIYALEEALCEMTRLRRLARRARTGRGK
jgi:hypothetical protein